MSVQKLPKLLALERAKRRRPFGEIAVHTLRNGKTSGNDVSMHETGSHRYPRTCPVGIPRAAIWITFRNP